MTDGTTINNRLVNTFGDLGRRIVISPALRARYCNKPTAYTVSVV